MSGALASLAESMLPDLESMMGGMAAQNGADSFASMAGGNAATGSGGAATSSEAGASSGAGSSGGGGEAASIEADLQSSADQTLAQADEGGFMHYELDLANGDGNAAARDLAHIVGENPSPALQQAAGVEAATIGSQADAKGGGQLSDDATQELQQALPNAQIDEGTSAIGKMGTDIAHGANSAVEGLGSGLGSALSNLGSGLGGAFSKGTSMLGQML